MVIPRFSIRWLLGLTAVCAAISLVLSYAARGEPWGIGAAIGLASLVLLFLLHAGTFAVAWLLSQALAVVDPPSTPVNPFGQSPEIGSLPAADPPEAAP
ncbi:MAG: hypothetical protein SFU86_21760 [Pirellulaceae bacterium]|nr:hypothetical protein [Pirellulaceae bacterium]